MSIDFTSPFLYVFLVAAMIIYPWAILLTMWAYYLTIISPFWASFIIWPPCVAVWLAVIGSSLYFIKEEFC